MADIPVANITEKNFNVAGRFKVWTAKVKGDGSGVTISVPFSHVTCITTGNIDDTSAIPGISFSAGVITYAAAPTNTKYHWLRIEGY